MINTEEYKCSVCGKVLPGHRNLSSHIWLAHQIRVGERYKLEMNYRNLMVEHQHCSNKISQLMDDISLLRSQLVIPSQCCRCKKPLDLDVTIGKNRSLIIEALERMSIIHIGCKKQGG